MEPVAIQLYVKHQILPTMIIAAIVPLDVMATALEVSRVEQAPLVDQILATCAKHPTPLNQDFAATILQHALAEA